VLCGVGLALALVVLAPYVVMVCTALKPDGELRINDCTIESNAGDGVLVDDEGTLWLSQCKVLANRGDGIRVGRARSVSVK